MSDALPTIDRDVFFTAVREQIFHGMTQSQVDGTNSILDAWEKDQPGGDLRFLAYMLATTWWETARTMRPIEEYGQGRGHAYGVPSGPWHKIYDGRGDTQLTWQRNYHKATKRLHSLGAIATTDDLEKTPELAMRPDIAAAVLIFGMIEGWFTGKKLADYIHGDIADFFNARRIINGLNKAQVIADTAHVFSKVLVRKAA